MITDNKFTGNTGLAYVRQYPEHTSYWHDLSWPLIINIAMYTLQATPVSNPASGGACQ